MADEESAMQHYLNLINLICQGSPIISGALWREGLREAEGRGNGQREGEGEALYGTHLSLRALRFKQTHRL